MNEDHTEHLNWVRFNCFEQSRKINKRRSIERIIKDAKKIEEYVLNKKPAPVVCLAKGFKNAPGS